MCSNNATALQELAYYSGPGLCRKITGGGNSQCTCVINMVRSQERCLGVLCIAIALLWSSAAKAETRVYLLRGWFWRILDRPRQPRRRAEEQGPQSRRGRTFGLEVDGLSEIVKDRAVGKSGSLVLVGHSQGANNVIEMARLLEKEKNSRRLAGYAGATVAGSSAGQCSAGNQLLPFTGLGRARCSPMLVFMASSRTSISAVTWAFPTSPWTRVPRSKRKSSAPSWPCRRRDRGQKNCEPSAPSKQPSLAASAERWS